MSNFTIDAVRRLGGPDWLAERRAAAFERFTAAPVPTEGDEIWRYSRVSRLQLDRFTPTAAVTTMTAADGLVSAAPPNAIEAVDPYFDELNEAFSTPLVLNIPPGQTIADPIIIDHTVRRTWAA